QLAGPRDPDCPHSQPLPQTHGQAFRGIRSTHAAIRDLCCKFRPPAVESGRTHSQVAAGAHSAPPHVDFQDGLRAWTLYCSPSAPGRTSLFLFVRNESGPVDSNSYCTDETETTVLAYYIQSIWEVCANERDTSANARGSLGNWGLQQSERRHRSESH